MKRLGNLFDQVVTFENLMLAAKKAFRRKKNKNPISSFYFKLEDEIIALQEELVSGTYRPKGYRQFEIREPKPRKICSSDFRDRVVHHAICNILEPVFEKRLISDTYACRVGKGSHAAIERVQGFARRNQYYLKCDIQKYFDSIDHALLKKLLRRLIKDPKLLVLLDQVIDHVVPGNPPGKGLPIGNLTSQHFANLYLGELDHFLKERHRMKAYVRYMDDFIVMSESKEALRKILENVRLFVKDQLALDLKEKVVRIAPVSEGVPFLGFRIFKNLIRIQRPNLIRMRRKLRKREAEFLEGKISEADLVQSMNSVIAHVSYGDTLMLRRKELDRSLRLA